MTPFFRYSFHQIVTTLATLVMKLCVEMGAIVTATDDCIFIDFDDKVMFLVVAEGLEAPDNIVIKPRPWQHDDRISSDELCEMRNIFWHNIPRFGGQPDIWRALRRAAEIDLPYAQAILDENNLRLGFRYELSLYMLSEPSNMHGKAEAGSGGRSSMMDRIRRKTW
ncbi:ubiquitin domain-containing protein 1-like protein [Tanacetum coccineum]